jgi:hypothetical protein
VVKAVNQVLGSLGLLKHPDKTFVGRIERGFDFLGYHFSPAGLSVAVKSVEQFVARAIRLYEQEPREALASARLGLYVRRWLEWAGAGRGERRQPKHPSTLSPRTQVWRQQGRKAPVGPAVRLTDQISTLAREKARA